ncbi:MAG: glycerol acyltransferase [Bacteroidetes bacterium]|nr:MAG: glycerol acyltransferase [Bacteroidota bacterium]
MAEKFIDIEKILSEKNPKLFKRLPKFILNYLKKILWEDEVNRIISENEGVSGVQFCRNVIKEFNINAVIEGIENAPKTGGVTFACNHPLGGMDALAFIDQFSYYREDIKFIANDVLLNLKPMQDIFVGVNKHGSTAFPSLKNVDSVLANDESVVIFPAGLVSRKKNGVIEDLEWKKTFVTRARKHNVPIIPVIIDGRLSNFFYNLSNLREKVGIKANIEMLYLVNELFKQKNTTIKIIFGKPIYPQDLSTTKKDRAIAQDIKRIAYDLKK